MYQTLQKEHSGKQPITNNRGEQTFGPALVLGDIAVRNVELKDEAIGFGGILIWNSLEPYVRLWLRNPDSIGRVSEWQRRKHEKLNGVEQGESLFELLEGLNGIRVECILVKGARDLDDIGDNHLRASRKRGRGRGGGGPRSDLKDRHWLRLIKDMVFGNLGLIELVGLGVDVHLVKLRRKSVRLGGLRVARRELNDKG